MSGPSDKHVKFPPRPIKKPLTGKEAAERTFARFPNLMDALADNSHSPDTLPVEADQATGAKSSSAPVAVSYPWRGRGFNPDSVG